MSDQNSNDNTRTHIVLTEGTMVQHYRIARKIGAGGMGEVYLAEDTKLKREVALKFMPSHLVTNPDVHTRFLREAQAVAKLNHPHIVTIHDVSEYQGRPYFVMEHIEGESLHHFAHDKPLPLEMIIEYAIQICQGLGEAHRAGIVHRDIKSANIAIDKKERVRILDFGLAAMAGDDKLTRTGSTLGTVSYMSPEQVSGREIDHRSDLFSFGVVLYELIAGRTPFRRDSEGSTLQAIMQEAPEPLSRYKADVPYQLQEIVTKLLDKDRELRYQSAEGVIADLKRLLYDSQPTVTRAASVPIPKTKRGMFVGLGIGAIAIIVVAIAVMWSGGDNTRPIVEDKVPMIAVLPFENLGAAEDEYFADGMTEEITSRLAGISGLGVISRTSSMKYKTSDKSLKEIGRDLGVDFILEGTVRWSKVGDQPRVRITPQLVRVSDDRHMWADNYERALMEVFAVQEDIATKIVDQMGLTLLAKDQQQLASRPTENPDAYRLYLKALNAIRRDRFSTYDPKEDLDSAVVLDPNFALAWALRSEYYTDRSFLSPNSDDAITALASAKRSLELQPGLAAGHLALGKFYNEVETDYGRALEEFSLAKSELHNDAELLNAIAYVQMRQGDFDNSHANYRKATEVDPLNPEMHADLSYSLAFTRNFDEAQRAIDRAIDLQPDRPGYYQSKIMLMMARYGEAEKLEPVIEVGLARCDTLKFAQSNWILAPYFPDLPWDSLMAENIKWARSNLPNDTAYYNSVFWMYLQAGNRKMMKLYGDSIRPFIEKEVKDSPENAFSNSQFGALLSMYGDCDQAVEYGLRGKELLSIDECHY